VYICSAHKKNEHVNILAPLVYFRHILPVLCAAILGAFFMEVIMGSKPRSKQQVFELLHQRSEKNGGCIEYTGTISEAGYGNISFNNKKVYVHRFIWSYHNGAIPEGMVICHHCDNRKCFNEDHLFLGTPNDNVQDMANKGRAKFGSYQREKTHCPQGHEYNDENTRRRDGRRSCRACNKIWDKEQKEKLKLKRKLKNLTEGD